jgi:hypothetical protein
MGQESRRQLLEVIGVGAAAALTPNSASSAEQDPDTVSTNSQASITLADQVDVQPNTGTLGFRPEPDVDSGNLYLGASSIENGGIHKVPVDNLQNVQSNTEVVGGAVFGGVESVQNDNGSDRILFNDTMDGELGALNDDTFEEEWRIPVVGDVNDIESYEGDAYVHEGSAETSKVTKLDSEGGEIWQTEVNPRPRQTMETISGDVFLGNGSEVTALDGSSGDELWSEDIGKLLERGVESLDGQYVVARTEDSGYILDSSDGSTVASVGGLSNDLGSDLGPIATDGGSAYVNDSSTLIQFSPDGEKNELSFDTTNTDLAAGNGLLFRGYADGIEVYDSENLDLLTTLEDPLPSSVIPDNIEVHDDGIITFTGDAPDQDKKIVYKAEVEPSPSPEYSVSGSGVIGDDLTLEASVDWVDGASEYSWSLTGEHLDGTPISKKGSDPGTWDISGEVASIDEEYAELTAELTVTDQNGETGSYAETFGVEALEPDTGVSGDRVEDGRVSVEDGSVSVGTGANYPGAVDEVYVEVADGDGVVYSETVQPGDSISIGDWVSEVGEEYSMNVEYRLSELDVEDTKSVTATPPSVTGNGLPRDPDDDGNYEKVRGGDGEPEIFDVQALFENLGSNEVQQYSEHYDFQGSGLDEVTIFDIQALFTQL